MAGIELRGVAKSFGATEILKGIDLQVADGEFFVLVGPSGCGKSTLLRIVAGLEEVDGGDVLIDGARVNDLPPARRGVAMVFQSYALYPHMTVRENMAFGLKLAGAGKAAIDKAVGDAAELLEVAHLLDRRPRALSGGQRQRVAIGRAIVREPKLFLFDEPLSNLDAELRVRMRYEFARLHRRLGTTTLYVTHDQVEAMTLADRIAILDRGAVAQVGDPRTLYERPASLFVAGFIGSPRMNFLAGTIAATGADGTEVRLADGTVMKAAVDAAGAAVGAPATLGVRPEHLMIGADGLAASTTLIESLGNIRFAYLDHGGGGEPLVVQLGADEPVAEGAAVRLSAAPGHCHLFDADGRAYRRHAAGSDTLAA